MEPKKLTLSKVISILKRLRYLPLVHCSGFLVFLFKSWRKFSGMSNKDGKTSMEKLIADAKKAMQENKKLNESLRQTQAQQQPLPLLPQWNDGAAINPAASSVATYPKNRDVKKIVLQEENASSALVSFEGSLEKLCESKNRSKALWTAATLMAVKGCREDGITKEVYLCIFMDH